MSPLTPRGSTGETDPRLRRLTIIGLIVVLVIGLITYAIFARRVPGTPRWTINAVFADSSQTIKGSPVRIAGVEVGRVQAVDHGPGTTAQFQLEIKPEGRPIHTDATAAIRPRLFLEGSYYVDLQPGSPSAPQLKRGGTIPLPQTTTPVQFSPVLSTFTRPVRESLITIIHQGSIALRDGGAAGLRDGLHYSGPAFKSGAEVLDASLGQKPGDLRRLIEGSYRISRALASQAPALGSLLTDANTFAAALADEDNNLTATMRGFDQVLRVAPPALTAARASLPSLRNFSRAIDPAIKQSPGVLRRTLPLLDQVRAISSAAELPRLLSITEPVSRELVTLAPKLRELLPRAQDVAKCIGHQGITTLNTKLDDGKLTSGQTAWQEFAHAYVNGGSTSQSFDGNGNYVKTALDFNLNQFALGSIPGVGVLLRDAQKPITGVRPVWNGPTPPPLRPDVGCNTQALPSFFSPQGGSDITQSTTASVGKGLTAAAFTRFLAAVAKHSSTDLASSGSTGGTAAP